MRRRMTNASCWPSNAWRRPLIGVVLLVASVPVSGQEPPRKYHAPAVVPLHGNLDLAAAKSFQRRLERANEAKSDLLIIEIDVTGGTSDGRGSPATLFADRAPERSRSLVAVPWAPGVAAVLCCDEVNAPPRRRHRRADDARERRRSGGMDEALGSVGARTASTGRIDHPIDGDGAPPERC